MNAPFRTLIGSACIAMLALAAAPAQSQVRITEVAPWSSGNSSLNADWFEVTNFGTTAITITGWKVDDNSNSFASSVLLNGITTIGAGESVIFVESASSKAAQFRTLWNAPATLQVGFYSGSGIGLSANGDALNLFNASGALQANVSFGSVIEASPFETFDNSIGVNNGTISLLAAAGTNQAYSIVDGASLLIGSPGAVPEPGTVALALLGLAGLGFAVRRRA